MTFAPILAAPLAIQLHLATVIPAALLGAFLLLRPKGTAVHQGLGKVWLLLMVMTAASTFFIHEIRMIGDFSPLHVLSAYVIVGSFRAVAAARRHDVAGHRMVVARMYMGGIVVAGMFSFLPGRHLNAAVFDQATTIGTVLAVSVLALFFSALAWAALRQLAIGTARKSRQGAS